jgi:hypothetical protein
MKRPSLGTLVAITWLDITSHNGWQDTDKWPLTTCHTVGWVVQTSDRCLKVAQSIMEAEAKNVANGCGNVMVIPLANIQKVKTLR